MSGVLRLIIFLSGIVFTFSVIYLLVKKRISERTSLIWLLGAIIVFVFSVRPKLLDSIASAFGVDYPPTLLFLYSIMIVLFLCLIHSTQITVLNSQVKELTQQIAIYSFLEEKRLEEAEIEEIDDIT